MKTTKCLYCGNYTEDPHFVSACCGRGMCDECYNNLQGTEEQILIEELDEENYKRLVLDKNVDESKGDYICMNDCTFELKKYYINYNVGSSKYVVNYHDWTEFYSDGSELYKIKIFTNKKEFNLFVEELKNKGYKLNY